MPSKKPIIHFNTEQWIIDKMKFIANENNRSLAKEMEYLCKQKIKEYEQQNGEINPSEYGNQQLENITNKLAQDLAKKMKRLEKKGKKTAIQALDEYIQNASEKEKDTELFKLITTKTARFLEENE